MMQNTDFDFNNHKNKAELDYGRVRSTYEDFAKEVERILKVTLNPYIKIHEFQSRAKTMESFINKACKISKIEPSQPRYPEPISDITDLAGVRVIAFFPKNIDEIENRVIDVGFKIRERRNIGEERFETGEFGYQSIHILVELPENRKHLPENEKFRDLVCEIQIRTILQHAWAEMEHDIQYKSSDQIPALLRRRFLALAGMIEIADREFQAIQDEDAKLKKPIKTSLEDDLITENFTHLKEDNSSVSLSKKQVNVKELDALKATSRSARNLVASGKYEEAISLYAEQISKKPSDHLLYAGLSKARFLSGDTKGAIADINRAILGVPDDDRLQRLKEQYEDGYASETPTVDLWTLVNKGNELLKSGRAEEAFGNYSKAQELGISFGLATFNKAMARTLSHDCDGASFFIEQLVVYPESSMRINILALRAIIAAACNIAPTKTFQNLKYGFDRDESRFDFSQSPLRYLEKGFLARDKTIKDSVQKVFELIKKATS